MDKENMISTNKASKMLGISPKTLRSWCQAGLISYFTTAGGRKRYAVQDIQDFLKKNFYPGNN